jgi:ATP-dependent helicase HrpA
MNGVRELEALWAARGRPPEVRWLLEELRVSHFAQALGVRGQVSAKKIRQLLQG